VKRGGEAAAKKIFYIFLSFIFLVCLLRLLRCFFFVLQKN